MRILVLYFSGTGNTARIAELLKCEMNRQGAECRIMPLERLTLGQEKVDFGKWDMIGLGFPVHAIDAPQIVYDALKGFPALRMPYFLFKTAGSGFLRGGSTYRIRKSLGDTGWELKHESLYIMPANLFSRSSKSKIQKRYAVCEKQAKQYAGEIMEGYVRSMPESHFRETLFSFASLEKEGAKKSSAGWRVSGACNLCGLCVKDCPTANILLENGKLVFGENCLLCLRCWWYCPMRALSQKGMGLFFLKEPYKLPPLPEENEREM